MNADMHERIAHGQGFLAALDQSGGSTPKALAQYGVAEDAYSTEDEMFDVVHQMRTRIITNPAFTGERVLGAILFEGTMERQIDGMPTSHYLWRNKRVVPFVKVDKGLDDEADGVQMMKPMPQLDDLLARARDYDVYGTKMRSVITLADSHGIARNVAQQFEVGHKILDAGLMPILEPEVDIRSPQKAAAEAIMKERILAELDDLGAGRQIMLKLTLPDEDGFFDDLVAHPQVLRVVALSGGYTRDEANDRLARNRGVIASFSRALVSDLSATQDEATFTARLDEAVASIFAASTT